MGLVYNLNNCLETSLVDLIQIENYKDVQLFICNEDCLKDDIEDLQILPTIPNQIHLEIT